MSHKKAAFEKIKDHTKNGRWHFCQAVLQAVAQPTAFVIAFISIWSFWCLLGVAAPTLTKAQTTSTPPSLDANGWTIFTPSADTHVIYVSDSTGSDSAGVIGDSTRPYKTLAKGMSLLRFGYPDWLLLKKGDTWTNQSLGPINKSGRSATEPMLISSYGTGAQPQVKVSAGAGNVMGVGSTYKAVTDYIAVVDIDFYAYLRDPANGATESASVLIGAGWGGASINWILIEGCKFRFFTNNIDVEPIADQNLPTNIVQNL